MKPGRVVHGDGEATVGEGPSLGSARGVGADDLGPRPTDPVFEQTISEIGDGGEQQIGNGTRRSTVHVLVSYIQDARCRESRSTVRRERSGTLI